jgi:hypothetical protein
VCALYGGMKNHYSRNSEYDTAWCGADALQGGKDDIYKVDCLGCLLAVVEIGKAARDQLEKVVRKNAVAEMQWSAFCLFWVAVSGHAQIAYLHDTGSIH